MSTFPVPRPVLRWPDPDWLMPHENASMSISPLCFWSADSPLMPSSIRNMSTAMDQPFPLLPVVRPARLRRLLRRQARDETQGHVHTFELVVRPQIESGAV